MNYIQEREKMFIGAVIQHNKILEDTDVQVEWLSDLRAKRIYDAAQKIYAKGVIVDLISLNDELQNKDLLEYAADAYGSLPSAALWQTIADEISNEYHVQKARAKMQMALSYKTIGEIAAAIDDISRCLKVTSNDVQALAEAMREFVETIRTRKDGITTPYEGLAEFVPYFESGGIYIIGGRPSDGKSSLLLSILARLKEKSGIISIETTAHEICARLISMREKITTDQIKTKFDIYQRNIALASADYIQADNIMIYDRTGNIEKVKQAMRQMVDKGCKLIAIDYMQLLRIPDSTRSKVEDLSLISSELKAFAKNHKLPLLVAAQLGRDADDGGAPKLSQLQWSSQLEQDADVVMMIRHKRDESRMITKSEIIIAKNRDGATGVAEMNFAQAFTLWLDKQNGVYDN